MDEQTIPRADPRLRHLITRLGVDAGARSYFEELRWPRGAVCPRCDSTRVGFIETRSKFQCRWCSYQFRCTAGTVLHDSHIAIAKWLLAVGLMIESESGFPAARLQQALGGSYKTAWFVEHRIRAAMANALLDHEATLFEGRASELPDAGHPARPGRSHRLERVAGGAYHRPSPQHLNAYWAEARWRAAHRDDPTAFRKTVSALLHSSPVPYDELKRRSY